MKNKYFFAVLLVCCFSDINAQNIEFTDDMEYPNGIPLSSTWWDCTPFGGCPLIVGPNAGHNSDYAGYIPGDTATDAILNLGNKIFGPWGIEFYMYVPSGKEAYFNLQGVIPVTSGEWIVGNINFNEALGAPGVGVIDWATLDPTDDTYFNFPHDEWFLIVMNIDISAGIGAATWQMYVNGIEAVQAGTPFADGNGNSPTSLGGIDFFSISSDNSFYLDDFLYFEGTGVIAGIEENTAPSFSIYPNPAQDRLHIVFEEEISEIRIYDLNGRLLTEGISEKTIDVSKFLRGVYFMELTSGSSKSVQKFIKE